MHNNYGATMAAAAAAAAIRAMHKEEERTHYGDEALSGEWEFKIVRARVGKFRKREEIENLLAAEAEFGWVRLEKLDNSRVRFKRHIKERSRDRMVHSDRDPYRSIYGWGQGRQALQIFAILTATLLIIGFVFMIVR